MKNKLTLMIIIRSFLFWVLAIFSLPIYNLLIIFIWPFPAKARHRIITSATHYYMFLLKYIGGIKYTITGLENLSSSPAIIAANHQSAWETVAFNVIFPPLVWIMKKEVLAIPLFGWGARMASPIAIDRKRGEDALAQVISQGRKRFEQGFWISVFPEGTRVKPKERKPFKYGPAKLALSLKVPIIPVAHNAGYCIPKNSFWLYPGIITIRVGKAIFASSDDPVLFTQQVEEWVTTQLNQLGA